MLLAQVWVHAAAERPNSEPLETQNARKFNEKISQDWPYMHLHVHMQVLPAQIAAMASAKPTRHLLQRNMFSYVCPTRVPRLPVITVAVLLCATLIRVRNGVMA
jgi:hypothetical protein